MEIIENLNFPIFSAESDIIITNISSVYEERRTSHWSYDRSKRYKKVVTYSLFLTTEGYNSIIIDGEEITGDEYSFSFITPDTDYKSHSVSETHAFIGIYFEAELPKGIENNLYSRSFRLPGMKFLKAPFEEIKNLFLKKPAGYKTQARQICYEILNVAFETYINKMQKKTGVYIIRNAIKHIEDNYTKEDISVEQLADICKLHPTYFAHVFKEAYNVSPKKYIIQQRMQLAKEYLVHTDYTIIEIAKLVGYSDPAYFSTAFKKEIGITPNEYKRRKSF